MERAIPLDLQQIERRLLAAFERHGGDGRAITLQSLAASVGAHTEAKEFRRALKDLVDRGLVRRAGEDPIPGSAIAYRRVAPAVREPVGKTEDQIRIDWDGAEQSTAVAPIQGAHLLGKARDLQWRGLGVPDADSPFIAHPSVLG